MLLKIEAKPININIIQVKTPTLDKSEEEIESFYEDIKQLLKYTKPHDLNIIQGDFNAKVGKGEVIGGVVGPWGLGERNIRGDRLIQFCQEEHFKIMNTWFSLPPRRLYTWRAPQDRPGNIVLNQIDFVLVNKRFSTTVSRAQTYPGADVPSDHCLLTISIKLKLALRKVNKGQIRKLDTSKLQQEEIKSDLRNKLNQKLKQIKDQTDQQPLEVWETVETTIKNVTIECLGYEKRRSNKKWMTDEILQLMDKRRQHKNTNHDEYKRLNSLIRSDIRKAKRKWLEGECKEIEYLQQIHNTREEHKKMKEASGIWLRSTFIPLPKKSNARKCKDHRLISLMNHSLKIFLKIIHRRIQHRCEKIIGPSQFGFKSDVNKDIFLCFVDYEKAFDRVQHSKLMQILRKTDVDDKDIRCFERLYWGQTANITIQNIITEDIDIRRAVRQGCVLSPLLFNLYSEAIFNEAFEEQELGVKVNGIPISNIRYADDTVLIANDVEKLQKMCTRLCGSSNEYGININADKTKFMIISRKNQCIQMPQFR
ncbi:uncharacterized protein LOC132705137 [Cylas formicarius]|uniref:uncharacterized protein LOC132705137 n=1 Tax=Cylas formicarius TaxID=197179 RepID=UPI002958AF90|nr:uncharacterized protein LOC132705137 [Cylas formicarius]